MAKALVIVESVAKATRIQGMLGSDYIVKPSVGHIRDLPQRAADVPAEIKKEPWGSLGINVYDHFTPYYLISPDRKKIVTELKAALKGVEELYVATDEDREGEAIAWHLLEVLQPKVPVKRMVFHEITPAAIAKAVEETRDLDLRLVNAQEGRRFLDRMVGYEVSPLLWRVVDKARSAGRVQSVAIRLVCERERERLAFRSASWHDVTVDVENGAFEASVDALNGVTLAAGKNFDAQGVLDPTATVEVVSAATAASLAEGLTGATLTVVSVTSSPRTQKPQAPFMTSSLQIEASRKLRFDPERTMRAAQRLYEQGWITYMRTDSTTLSQEAIHAARKMAREAFGDDYVADEPRRYDRKVKNAQEAHEAIRPAGEEFRSLDEAQRLLSGDEFAVYDLIWKRTVASQMVDAQLTQDKVRLSASVPAVDGMSGPVEVALSASGLRIEFPGFRRAYVEGSDDPEAELADQERILPPLREGDSRVCTSATAKSHDTQPPDRYSEATLIKKLEDLGIGRPSTYASVMKTIDRRGYVWKKGKSLVPAFRAFGVINFLNEYLPDLIDYQFTAQMEDQLDAIASGEQDLEPWLHEFYFGNASSESALRQRGLHAIVSDTHEYDYAAINSLFLGNAPDGLPITVRSGRYGPYLSHGDDKASIPEATEPDSLTVERALALLAAPSNDRQLGVDEATGLPVFAKAGRFGPYVQLGELVDPKAKEKPKTASLFTSMSLETLTFEDAQKLLSLPRTVGLHPEDGAPIEATNGRYGPYITWGKETRSLDTEDLIFSITPEDALALLAQPKQRGRRAAAGPLRELGVDPVTKLNVVVRSGKFGNYVTDGQSNATMRIADTVEGITLDRACELLAEKRNVDPDARPARPAKKVAKKTTKKAAKKPSKGATKRTAVAKGKAANAALLASSDADQ